MKKMVFTITITGLLSTFLYANPVTIIKQGGKIFIETKKGQVLIKNVVPATGKSGALYQALGIDGETYTITKSAIEAANYKEYSSALNDLAQKNASVKMVFANDKTPAFNVYDDVVIQENKTLADVRAQYRKEYKAETENISFYGENSLEIYADNIAALNQKQARILNRTLEAVTKQNPNRFFPGKYSLAIEIASLAEADKTLRFTIFKKNLEKIDLISAQEKEAIEYAVKEFGIENIGNIPVAEVNRAVTRNIRNIKAGPVTTNENILASGYKDQMILSTNTTLKQTLSRYQNPYFYSIESGAEKNLNTFIKNADEFLKIKTDANPYLYFYGKFHIVINRCAATLEARGINSLTPNRKELFIEELKSMPYISREEEKILIALVEKHNIAYLSENVVNSADDLAAKMKK